MSSPTSPTPTDRSKAERRPVHVTMHAQKRARERHSDLRVLQDRDLLRRICWEVTDAIAQRRVARNAPRETVVDQYTHRSKAEVWMRFAWNGARSRVYVFRRDEGQVVVVTVLATVHSQR